MVNTSENTLSAYLGIEFQEHLMWQLLVEPEFAEKVIPDLAIEYFDDPNLKRLFLIILEYYKEFQKVPNLQNQSIHHAINRYKKPNNVVEEESLFGILKRIELWNTRIINKQMLYDGDVIQKSTTGFIKQQEYRKLAEGIIDKVKTGEIKNKYAVVAIEDRFQKITHIGDDEDDCEDVTEGIDRALRKEFRETIPTGIGVIDSLTGGGLGKGEIGLILTPSGVGKALPNSHKVLTLNGWVENGTLKVNDTIFGSDGNPQKILAVYPQGIRKIYKIIFSDQTTSFCDSEHLWSVNSFKQRNRKTKINGKTLSIPDHTFQVLTTSEMMKDFNLNGSLNYRLPNVMPIQFNKVDVKIDPYIMGVLLGDGCITRKNQPYITTSDRFIVDKIKNIDQSIVVHEYEGRKENYKKLYRLSLLNSRSVLENELGLYGTNSSTKFIPQNYLYNSIEYREKLLQGLIDSNGGVGKNGAIIYTTVSKELSKNVKELVLSLGGTCRTTEKIKFYTNKIGIKIPGKNNYRLTISFPNNDIIPCTLPAKLDRIVFRNKYEYNKFIKNIEYSHEEEATCIYVENDDHLYVIDDYVLTHNTTALTIIANTAYEDEKNVAQIIFEDTKDQIKRKHYTIWAKSALSKLNDEDENERVTKVVHEKVKTLEGKGRLIIKRFSQENTTMMDIRNWMTNYQKKYGFKFDLLVLDYLDCVESHKKSPDRNEAELAIIKGFEALSSDFNIPAWSAIQSNRSGFGAEFVEAHQSGGSIKRIQKAHFFMSVAKTPAQQEANFANIRILKARFAKDGQTFEDCIFNNDTMEIIINDSRYIYTKTYKNLKHYDEKDIENLEKNADKLAEKSTTINIHEAIINRERILIDELNNNDVGDGVMNNPQKINELLRINMNVESNIQQSPEIIINEVKDNKLIEICEDNDDLETGKLFNDTDEIEASNIDTSLFEWTGNTETENIAESVEIELDDVKIISEAKEEKLIIPKPKIIEDLPLSVIEQNLIDPDEIDNKNKNVQEILTKLRKGQAVIKKE